MPGTSAAPIVIIIGQAPEKKCIGKNHKKHPKAQTGWGSSSWTRCLWRARIPILQEELWKGSLRHDTTGSFPCLPLNVECLSRFNVGSHSRPDVAWSEFLNSCNYVICWNLRPFENCVLLLPRSLLAEPPKKLQQDLVTASSSRSGSLALMGLTPGQAHISHWDDAAVATNTNASMQQKW